MAMFLTRPFYRTELPPADGRARREVASPIAGLTALFTACVLALQTAYSLAAFGGKIFTRPHRGALARPRARPVLHGLMVSGRVGSGITAELGSMTVTEQVDALRAMADSPPSAASSCRGCSPPS
jgi:ABC-type transporter Mla maintaining outer membrane lipid asymmetry permease subunit MlaE